MRVSAMMRILSDSTLSGRIEADYEVFVLALILWCSFVYTCLPFVNTEVFVLVYNVKLTTTKSLACRWEDSHSY